MFVKRNCNRHGHIRLWQALLMLHTTLIFTMALPVDEDTKNSLESEASHMHLSPVELPAGASQELHAIAEELPFELLNPPILKHHTGHLTEGDIVMTDKQWEIIQENMRGIDFSQWEENEKQSPRKAVTLNRLLWRTDSNTGFPTIPFRIGSSVSRGILIRNAMKVWEAATCIVFEEITDGLYNKPHVEFIEGRGCWSYVGMTGEYGQDLSIGANCYREGIILHEMGHAMGLYHEHSRTDRSNYVKINYTNVNAGSEVNFFQEQTNNYNVPYDYSSIMHYSSTAFSKNGRSTVLTLNPSMQGIIGQRDFLSFRDISIVNQMYDCPGKWESSCTGSPPTCVNGGYMGKDCTCVCPPGTTGDTCETVNGDYYPTPTCGGNITQEGTIITSPNYPENYPADSSCVWWIQSQDDCKHPAITVDDFQLFIKMPNGQCAVDRLEIRTDSIYSGNEYCETDLAPGTTLVANGRDLVLFFSSKVAWKTGFKFVVSFVDICLGCEATTSDSATVWKSPQYPANYPPNQICDLTVTKPQPTLTYLTFDSVNLPTDCRDYIRVVSAHGTVTKICGTMSGSRQLIGSYHLASFSSGSLSGTNGWSISFTTRSSACHQKIELTESSPSGVLKSPLFPKNYPKNSQCEWWLSADIGRKIKLEFQVLRLATNLYFPTAAWYIQTYYQKLCQRGFVLVSLDGDPNYVPGSDSYQLCGYRDAGFTLISNAHQMNLLFYGGLTGTMGMKVTYSLL